MARGRKSAASLSVVPVVPGRGRPEPPPDLDELESRIWREVIDALPSHWLDGAGQLILRRLAAQAAVSEARRGACASCEARGRTMTRRLPFWPLSTALWPRSWRTC